MVDVVQLEAAFILEPNAHSQLQRRDLFHPGCVLTVADEHKFWSGIYFWLGTV